MYNKYDKHGWKGKPPGMNSDYIRAGGTFDNNKNQLPTKDVAGQCITYKEFDVNVKTGISRDAERFLYGSDGSVYYTDSHYGEGTSLNGYPPYVKIK